MLNRVLLLLSFLPVFLCSGQGVLSIIDSTNASFGDKKASFSYDVKVDYVSKNNSELYENSKVIVNNTVGKYDDFLVISLLKNDTFCFVKDTLFRMKAGEIRKDYSTDALNISLGTTKMFYKCFSRFFRNDLKLINHQKWDSLRLDSTDMQFYYISLYDTLIEYETLVKRNCNIKVDKKNYHLVTYKEQRESKGIVSYHLFTFSNWSSSMKLNEDVHNIFEKTKHRSNSYEYLSIFPTRKMRVQNNLRLSLDDLSIIDTTEINYRIGDFDKRYVVLYFWFQGCVHCKHVGPVIEKFSKTNNRKDILYLGVDTMSKDKMSLLESIRSNHYDFPNYRYNEGVKDLAVNGAPTVIIYDNLENKIVEQLLGGKPDYEELFSKLINSLPIE